MTDVAILIRRQMAYRLDRIRVIGNEPTDMTPFTATANAWMYRRQECRRCETTTIRVTVAYTALILCRDVILRLSYSADPNIIEIAIVAGLTIVSDARVNKALCRFERGSGNVAYIAVLLRG